MTILEKQINIQAEIFANAYNEYMTKMENYEDYELEKYKMNTCSQILALMILKEKGYENENGKYIKR